MDRIREQIRNPLIAAIAGFVLGLIIGLPLLGWGLWPLQWEDAEPQHLRDDLKAQYLCMTIDSYVRHNNAVEAKERFESLGDQGEDLLNQLAPGTCNLSENEITGFKALVLGSAIPLPQGTEALPGATEEAPTPAGGGTTGGSRIVVVLVLCLAVLLVAGILVYLLVLRKRVPGAGSTGGATYVRPATSVDYATEGQETPVAQFMTTYMAGDDLYDDSFSIDSPSGEFLGECGVGIADTIGVGDPKKVTAFEVWLFDKNDIQTVTKVLMSEHAFADAGLQQKLASKGEPVVIEPDTRILLETATLQLEARVVDLNYGQGALPEHSFFERLTLELAVWPKPQA